MEIYTKCNFCVRFLGVTLLMILIAALVSCSLPAGGGSGIDSDDIDKDGSVPVPDEDPVIAAMNGMTIEEKVGQLFIIRPDALDPALSNETINDPDAEGVLAVSGKMAETYLNYPAGGFCIFGKNIDTPTQVRALNRDLHALNSEFVPLICIDEEGGWVARLANSSGFDLPKFDNMQYIAQTGDPGNAYHVGYEIGRYLSEYGIDVDFAPVADVNTNPDNPIIGVRAFGDDPQVAAEMVAAVIEGLHSQGIMSSVKHFPGHGDTKTDTHTGTAETLKTWEEITACEMIPFMAGIEAGTDFVMVAHIALPNVTGTDEPASMSYLIMTEKLRGELGYEGLIITDAIAMDAINETYGSSAGSVQAILAGADVVLMPYDYEEAFNAVVDAVRNGTITAERLDESVYRILSYKLK